MQPYPVAEPATELVARVAGLAVDWVADTIALHGVVGLLDFVVVVGKVATPQSNPVAELATEHFAQVVDLWFVDTVALRDLLDQVAGKVAAEAEAEAVDKVAGTAAAEIAPEAVDRVVGDEAEAAEMVVETVEIGVVGVALDKVSGLADYKVG